MPRTPEDWALNEWHGKIFTFRDAIIFVARVQADAKNEPFDPSKLKIDLPEHLAKQLDRYNCEDCGCSREANKKCVNATCKSNQPAAAVPDLTKPASTKNVSGENNKRYPAYDGQKDKLWFGKHKGERLDDVPPDYLAWLFSTGIENEKLRNYIWNARHAINQDLSPRAKENKITKYVMP